MREKPNFLTMEEIARKCSANFAWAMSNPYDNEWGHTIYAVGPEWENDDGQYDDGYDFYESTLLEVWGHEYDSESIARFISTFDPPTVMDLLKRATLRDEELLEQCGTVDGKPIYRRLGDD